MATQVDLKQDSRFALKSVLPILAWLPNYQRTWLRGDIMAAITVWALLVPEAMAYAGIAGMPPETGLYAAPLALLAYAIFGTSRQLNVGPSSTVAILSFAVVSAYAVAESTHFIALTVATAMLAGLFLILGGLFKLGALADFLSKPVLRGFIIGLAISIAVGQLEKLLGYEVEVKANFIPDVLVMAANFGLVHWPTLIVGAASLAALFVIERYYPRIPGAITVVLLAIALSALLRFESFGIHVVGEIPAGLPSFGMPEGIGLGELVKLIPGAVAIALVGFAESVAAARSYATKYGYEVDANQEMVALGLANVGSGFSGAFSVDGSLSKSAASDEAGAKSQMVSIIVTGMVLVTVVALTPLFYSLPEATLGAIVIHAVWHLIDFNRLRRYYAIRRIDFYAGVVAMVGVVSFGILQGLMLAVFLSLLGLLIQAKQARGAILGKVTNQNSYRSLENYPDAETWPGLIIYRFDEQIFFANASNFRDAVRAAIAAEPVVTMVLVDAESINEIDVTASDMLLELTHELEQEGIALRFARMKTHVRAILDRSGVTEIVGADHFYGSIQTGVDAFLASHAARPAAAEASALEEAP